jgi:hydroxylamine reductase (hybrid-cluster protein)
MSKSVTLPDEIYEKAAALARAEQVSVDAFVSGALADQLAARNYLAMRAARASREKFVAALDRVPDVEPEEHDRL